MDEQYISKQLTKWIVDFVERPNKLLGDWPPCPYARKTRLENKLHIFFCRTDNFCNCIEEAKLLLESKDVIVMCFDHTQISVEQLQKIVKDYNQQLMQQDYVILEDHPYAPEFVNGCNMNFGICGLLLLQRLSKLNEASKQLKNTSYYDSWDNAAFKEVVAWRHGNL